MIDITQSIATARTDAGSWANNLFFAFIEELEKNNYNISYWEGEERWATISANELVVGYMWCRYPLVFIVQQYSNGVIELNGNRGSVVVVAIDELNSKVLSADMDVLKEVDLSVDMPFSAEDVWFNNNSI